MASLLDIVKGNRGSLAGEKAELTDETAKAATLLRARTGKVAGPTPGVVQSNLGEQAAVADTQAALDSTAATIQTQQVAGDIQARQQEQQAEQVAAQATQARKFQTVETKMKTNQLLSQLSRDRGTIEFEKDKAALEQTTFLMSMQDKAYVDQLQDIGRRTRLDNEVAFGEEMQRLAIGSSLALLKDKLKGRDVLSASDRDFAAAMSALKVEDALRIAKLEMADTEAQAALEAATARETGRVAATSAGIATAAQGLSGLVKGGVEAASISRPAGATVDQEGPTGIVEPTRRGLDYALGGA